MITTDEHDRIDLDALVAAADELNVDWLAPMIDELTAVYDVESIGLVRVLDGLNRGVDLAANPIGGPTAFLIGVGANPGAVDLDREVQRFRYKVEAGASFCMTQPVYEQVEDLGPAGRSLGRLGRADLMLTQGRYRDALGLLDELRESGRRVFLWVHYQDPHGPYTAPSDYTSPPGPAPASRPWRARTTRSRWRPI